MKFGVCIWIYIHGGPESPFFFRFSFLMFLKLLKYGLTAGGTVNYCIEHTVITA